MRLEHAMAEFGTVLTLVGSVCCCISVFLVAMIGFSFAFRPKRARGADVKGIAPAPTRGVATQASLTRMEEDRVDTRGKARPTAGPQVDRSVPAAPPNRPVAPASARPPPPPAPENDATVRQATPARPAVPPPVSTPAAAVSGGPPPLSSGPPPLSSGPPPVPGPAAVPPPVPAAARPPPIPPGTRLLQPSPTIAPGSGDEPLAPPPRKV